MGEYNEEETRLFTMVPSIRKSTGTGCPEVWGLLPRDLPELPGCGPGNPALGAPAGAGTEPDGCRDPFQPKTFCDPMISTIFII